MEDDGTEAMRLMTSPASPLFFAWHPQGRGLTYSCAIKGQSTDICLKNLYNHFDINLTEHPDLDQSFTWSPDGTRLVFGSDRAGRLDLYVLNLLTQELRRLTDLPENTRDPIFAPDGQHLAFVADQDGTDQHFAVYVLDLGKNELLRISDTRGHNRPLWFPDSQYLLINTDSHGAWEYYRVKRDGSEREKLGDGQVFSIHPDGKKLLIQSSESGRQQVKVVILE
jgi:TolB protein